MNRGQNQHDLGEPHRIVLHKCQLGVVDSQFPKISINKGIKIKNIGCKTK